MAEGGRGVGKPALGVLGVLVAIAGVWWFAFRPRGAPEVTPQDPASAGPEDG